MHELLSSAGDLNSQVSNNNVQLMAVAANFSRWSGSTNAPLDATSLTDFFDAHYWFVVVGFYDTF